MKKCSDFIEAKHKCKRLYDEHTERTGEGHKPIPLQHSKSDNDVKDNLRASMNTISELNFEQDGDFTLHFG